MEKYFIGKNGLIPALNSRLFIIRRLANQIPADKMKNLVDSLWMSKLRYGLQLCIKVRVTDEDTQNQKTKLAQIAQSKVLWKKLTRVVFFKW